MKTFFSHAKGTITMAPWSAILKLQLEADLKTGQTFVNGDWTELLTNSFNIHKNFYLSKVYFLLAPISLITKYSQGNFITNNLICWNGETPIWLENINILDNPSLSRGLCSEEIFKNACNNTTSSHSNSCCNDKKVHWRDVWKKVTVLCDFQYKINFSCVS